MKLIISFILFSMFSSAYSTCANIDLNINTPLKDMPVLDQDGVGLCYAYAAQQLIDFKLRSEKSALVPSALDLSLRASSVYRTDLEGGQVKDVVEAASASGVIEKSCIEKQIKDFTGDPKMTTEKYNLLLNEMYNASSIFTADKTELAETKKEINKNPYLQGCSSTKVLNDIYKKGQWGDSVISILKLTLNPCEKLIKKIGKFEYENIDSGSDLEIKSKLDKILNSKKPAAVSLCAEALEGPGVTRGLRGWSPPFFRGSNGNLDFANCSGHALLAVGSRSVGGKCQYLLRNSWGGYWQPFGIKCACKTSQKYYADCPDFVKNAKLASTIADLNKVYEEFKTRVYVGCWYDSKKLLPNITDVGAIK